MDWHNQYNMNDLCFNCGERCGRHHAMEAWCPNDNGSGGFSTTNSFAPQQLPALPANVITILDACKKKMDETFGTNPVSKECPCGIVRQDCDYHRASP